MASSGAAWLVRTLNHKILLQQTYITDAGMRPMLGRHVTDLENPLSIIDFLKGIWIAQIFYTAVLREDEDDDMGHGGSMYRLVCCHCKTFLAALESQVLIIGPR
jgi:hypothetical protein